jgi:hypothetical protein
MTSTTLNSNSVTAGCLLGDQATILGLGPGPFHGLVALANALGGVFRALANVQSRAHPALPSWNPVFSGKC